MACPVTVVIPTFNEEVNIGQALQSVTGWANQIIVVDSFSTDRTLEVAQQLGAETCQNKYEHMAQQRMWGLSLPAIRNDWVLNLDADEFLTSDLKREIERELRHAGKEISGFLIRRRHYFLGRWMKHGGDYIWLLRLVRRGRCRVIKTPIINEHTIVDGQVKKLREDFVHQPRKDLTAWMQRVNTGAQKFALSLQSGASPELPAMKPSESVEGSIRTSLNYMIYAKLPLWSRPFARFFVFYFLRGGILDGWQGFIYHVINDFVYPFLVWAKCKEYTQNPLAKNLAESAKWR